MQHHRLEDMVKGWFVGDFEPTVVQSKYCEVALKHYTAGAYEITHYHAVALELTLIVSGQVFMLGREWGAGDIISIEPNEVTDFRAITDVVTVVVKLPSALNDKYLVK